MLAFKLNVEDASRIVDQFNEVQNNYRISAESLSEGFSVVGVSAEQAGVKIEELTGYLTSIAGATGMSGNTIGMGLKTIFSRLYRIGSEGMMDEGKAESALNQIGISVRNANGEFRNFNDIITELYGKWNTLTKVQKQHIAQTVGGTHHIVRFTALMENFGTAIEATELAMNSQGSALKENEKYLDSIAGRIELLKNAMEEFYENSLNSELFKGLITGVETLVRTFSSLENIMVVAGIALSIFLAKKNISILGMLGNSIGGVGKSFGKLTNNIRTATVGMGKLAKAGKAVKMTLTSIKTALGPIGLALIAFEGLSYVYDSIANKSEREIETLKESSEKYQEQKDKIDALTQEYKNNFEAAKNNDEIKIKLAETEIKLRDALGGTIEGLGKENSSLEENVKLLKEKAAIKRDAFLTENKDSFETATNQLYGKTTGSNIFDVLDQAVKDADLGLLNRSMVQLTNKGVESSSDTKRILMEQLGLSIGMNLEEQKKHFGEILKDQDKYLQKSRITSDVIKVIGIAWNNIEDTTKTLNDIRDPYIEALKEEALESEKILEKKEKLTNAQQKIFDIAAKTVKFENSSQFSDSLNDIFKNIEKYDNGNLKDLVYSMKDLGYIDLSTIKDGFFDFGETLSDAVDPVQELTNLIMRAESEVGLLSKAYSEMEENQELSLGTVEELLKQDKDYIKYLEIEGDTIKINTDIIKDQFEIKKQSWIKEAEAQKQKVIDLKNSTLESMGWHTEEIKSVEGVAKAYNELVKTKVRPRAVENLISEASGNLTFEDRLDMILGGKKNIFENKSMFGVSDIDNEVNRLLNEDPRYSDIANLGNFEEYINAQDKRIEVLKTIGLNTSSSKKDKKDSAFKPPEDLENTYNFFVKFEQQLESVNTALEQNRTLQENATGDNLKDLQEKELDLLKQKNKVINDITWEYGHQRDVAKDTLTKPGVNFDDKGVVDPNSLFNTRQKLASEYNAIDGEGESQDKAREDAKKAIEDFDKYFSDYLENFNNYLSSSSELTELTQEIKSKSFESLLKSLFEDSEKYTKEFENELKDLESRISFMPDGEEKNVLIQTSIDKLSGAVGYLAEEYIYLIENTDEATKKTDDFKDKIRSLKDTTQGLVQQLKQSNEELLTNKIEAVKKTEDIIKNLIKKGIEERKKVLDEELEEYSDAMDKKIEIRSREFEEIDYQDDLKKQMKEVQDVQNQINVLSFDRSFEAYQKRKELEEKLAEEKEKLSEMGTKRNRELELRALKDSKTAGEKVLKDKKDSIDEVWTEEKIALEAKNSLINKNFDDLKTKFPELFESISSKFSTFQTEIVSFETKFGSAIGNSAAEINSKLIPTIKVAISNVSKLSNLQKDLATGSGIKKMLGNNTEIKRYNDIERAKEQIGKHQTEWNSLERKIKIGENAGTDTVDLKNKQFLEHLRARNLRNKYDIDDKTNFAGYTANLIGYANGGINTTTGLAMLHGTPSKPEYILNTQQFNNLINNIGSGMTYAKTGGIQARGNINNNLTININGSADSSTVGKIRDAGNNILRELKRTMNKNGTHR